MVVPFSTKRFEIVEEAAFEIIPPKRFDNPEMYESPTTSSFADVVVERPPIKT